jgi:hypothetical protein
MIDMKNHNERKNACKRMRRDQLSTSLPPSKSSPTLFILTQIHIILPPLSPSRIRIISPQNVRNSSSSNTGEVDEKVGCPNKCPLFRRVVLVLLLWMRSKPSYPRLGGRDVDAWVLRGAPVRCRIRNYHPESLVRNARNSNGRSVFKLGF